MSRTNFAEHILVADAHRDGKRFIVHADEKLTAFVEFKTEIADMS